MKINEIFYSVQGEGHYTGTPAVFLRFSGCNQQCSFCDTQHQSFTEMTEADIINAVCQYPARHIVITGGEPTLQLTATLVDSLHAEGFFVQIETNGSCLLPEHCDVDWITCSPKAAPVIIQRVDELKQLYWGQDVSQWEAFPAREHRLQPLDSKDPKANADVLRQTIDYILQHPVWSLSLQTHKIINVQ